MPTMAIKFSDRNTPRWIIFLIDLSICACSLMLAYQVRFNFRVPEHEIALWMIAIPALLGTRIISFFIFKIYSGIIRYTGTKDALRVFYTVTAGSIFLALANPITNAIWKTYLLPYSILIIDFITTVFSL